MLILSAPFGNWLEWEGCTSTLGSFTREYRGGVLKRLWRIARTVRYYPGIQAWKNQLGLPNPGIDWLRERVETGRINIADKIVSISAHNTRDWEYLIEKVGNLPQKPLAVELNVSCPNCGDDYTTSYYGIFALTGCIGTRVIVKLPPINYRRVFEEARYWDIGSFHCCNTLPIPSGGLSGKPLKTLSLEVIRQIRTDLGINMIIGGGGITCQEDINDYRKAGATDFSVGSVLFFPWKWGTIKALAKGLGKSK